MTDDLVKRLRRDLASGLSASIGDTEEAADRIEQLQRALLDVAQYASIVDLGFLAKLETRKVLDEIWEKTDD